jgi:hypothetical protein
MSMRACLVLALLFAASPSYGDGRFAEVTLGGTVAGTAGDENPPAIPTLLRNAPELQIAWGIHLGDAAVITRLDLLGAMVPIGPAGVGVDIGGGWYPHRDRAGWAPVVRGFAGGILFGSGGDMLGPDHNSRGFRLALEAGAVTRRRVPAGWAGWGILVGAQTIGLLAVDPCSATGDCDAVLFGATARLEGHLVF